MERWKAIGLAVGLILVWPIAAYVVIRDFSYSGVMPEFPEHFAIAGLAAWVATRFGR